MKFICMHCYLSPADKKEGEDAVPLDDENLVVCTLSPGSRPDASVGEGKLCCIRCHREVFLDRHFQCWYQR
ncbi:MAG: hypothetical protein AB1710_05245 [Pseudomonadota bacterium]